MALFLRVFISLFLFLSQSVYALGMDGGADVDYTYYERAGECSISYQTFCTSDVFPKSTSNQLVTQIGCGLYGHADPQAHYSTQWRAGWNVEPVGSIIFGNDGLAATRHKTCSSTEEFQLNGCTATCVTKPPEPCLAKKDQIKTLSVQCGTFNCPSNSHTVLNGLIVCDKQGGYFTSTIPSSSASYEGCALQAQAVPEFGINDAVGKNSEVGGQTQAGFCNVEYKYTGTSGSATDTPTMTNGTGFNVSYLPAGEGGQCSTGYKPGTQNGFNICVPDSGESGTECPSGQIRNNSGKCVPTSEAGLPDGSTTNTNPDGSTTTTTKSTTHNSNGSTTTTTTTETTKTDGTKTKKTQTVTTSPNGTTTKKTTNETTLPNGKKLTSESETTTEETGEGTNKKKTDNTTTSSKGQNPDGSSFDNKANDSSNTTNADGTSSSGGDGGSCPNGGCNATTSAKCDTPPTCSGDPLVCASINQQWISTCKQTEALTKITTEEKTASDAAIAASNSEYSTAKSNANVAASGILNGFTNSVDSGSKSGTCIVDATLPVMGKSLKIPFSQACAFFKFLRMLVIFMSYLAAMRIVYKGAV